MLLFQISGNEVHIVSLVFQIKIHLLDVKKLNRRSKRYQFMEWLRLDVQCEALVLLLRKLSSTLEAPLREQADSWLSSAWSQSCPGAQLPASGDVVSKRTDEIPVNQISHRPVSLILQLPCKILPRPLYVKSWAVNLKSCCHCFLKQRFSSAEALQVGHPLLFVFKHLRTYEKWINGKEMV